MIRIVLILANIFLLLSPLMVNAMEDRDSTLQEIALIEARIAKYNGQPLTNENLREVSRIKQLIGASGLEKYRQLKFMIDIDELALKSPIPSLVDHYMYDNKFVILSSLSAKLSRLSRLNNEKEIFESQERIFIAIEAYVMELQSQVIPNYRSEYTGSINGIDFSVPQLSSKQKEERQRQMSRAIRQDTTQRAVQDALNSFRPEHYNSNRILLRLKKAYNAMPQPKKDYLSIIIQPSKEELDKLLTRQRSGKKLTGITQVKEQATSVDTDLSPMKNQQIKAPTQSTPTNSTAKVSSHAIKSKDERTESKSIDWLMVGLFIILLSLIVAMVVYYLRTRKS